MNVLAPEMRDPRVLWAAGSIGLILMASVYDSWSDGERDAFKDGIHSCKEGLPPTRGSMYDDPYECEAWYEGYWRGLESKKATAAAVLVSGLAALLIFRRRE